jgi:hypothetical protein
MTNPELVRNVAVVGHLHHGKTSVMDMFVEQTHDLKQQALAGEQQLRFTDTRFDEQVGSTSAGRWSGELRRAAVLCVCVGGGWGVLMRAHMCCRGQGAKQGSPGPCALRWRGAWVGGSGRGAPVCHCARAPVVVDAAQAVPRGPTARRPALLQARQMSIKMMPMSLVMESAKGKSYLMNLMDCPGHVNFNDEVRVCRRPGAGGVVLRGSGATWGSLLRLWLAKPLDLRTSKTGEGGGGWALLALQDGGAGGPPATRAGSLPHAHPSLPCCRCADDRRAAVGRRRAAGGGRCRGADAGH